MKNHIYYFIAITIFFAVFNSFAAAADPGKPDEILMDSVSAKIGQKIELGIKFWVDDTIRFENKDWYGIGTLCIPIKYDSKSITIDSVKFLGILSKWDEKFTNPKIDTGFVSFNGIHNIGGKEKPTIFTAGKPEEMIKMYISISPKAKPGIYDFQLTADPLQKELYFGSPDGVHSWKPKFVPGKILVK